MSEQNSPPATPPDINAILTVIRGMVGEVHPHWKNLHFSPDTHLERELGLDSMARAELRLRIESTLAITLDEEAAICATTPNKLLDIILSTGNPAAKYPAQQINTPAGKSRAQDLLMGSFGQPEQETESEHQHSMTEWLYALYCWGIFSVLMPVTWIGIMLIPLPRWRRLFAQICARLLFKCTFIPFTVTGHEYLDPEQPQIIVANHASYLDGFIVTAALNIPIHFIVKGELAGVLPVRLLLQRFGVEFVDRFNSHKGASDVRRIAQKSQNGQSIVFFPEGTFTSFPGLQPFRMGAFVTAARADIPVVPVAICGARTIIHSHHWFPQRGRVTVSVRPPIQPAGAGWQVALTLRDSARKEIAGFCGEPDLVEETAA